MKEKWKGSRSSPGRDEKGTYEEKGSKSSLIQIKDINTLLNDKFGRKKSAAEEMDGELEVNDITKEKSTKVLKSLRKASKLYFMQK